VRVDNLSLSKILLISVVYVQKAQSVSGAVMNFLSAVALVNNGVREILPFIRYIAQFVEFEFSAIKKQDFGDGVVCAATWYVLIILKPCLITQCIIQDNTCCPG
jgi:hypothetical protein